MVNPDLAQQNRPSVSEKGGMERNLLIEIHARSIASSKHPEQNEDSMFMDPEKGIFGVFDGLGGQAAGDKASQIARDIVSKSLQELPKGLTLLQAQEGLYRALIDANLAIHEQRLADYNDMATTASIGMIWNDSKGEKKVTIGNVGDSRVYLLRNGELEQVTLDDSTAYSISPNEQQARQLQTKFSNVVNPERELTEIELYLFSSRNLISQCLGTVSIKPRITTIDLLPSDMLLVCSDGISDNLTGSEMQTLLNSNPDTNIAVQKLIEASQTRSKSRHARAKADDMTALIVEVRDNAINS